jgi:hypothetical protein
LPRVNVKPWRTAMPVVVQSVGKDMQCSIGADGAACHLLNEVPPRPGDVKGQCTGLSQYYGGYAVVTLEAGGDPAQMVCAHLRTGHGFLISAENYELW